LVSSVELQAEGTVLVKPRTDVVIKCTSNYSSIHWFKNGKPITAGEEYHVDEETGTLTIVKAGNCHFG